MRQPFRVVVLAAFIALVSAWSPAFAQTSGLVQAVVKQVGVTEQQAQGGTGLLLNYAKNNLQADEFQKVTTSMPEVTTLAASGAALQKKSGGALSGLPGGLGAAAGLASLAGPFKSLGMSPDMVMKMAPVVLDYAKTTGGAETGSLLGKVLTK